MRHAPGLIDLSHGLIDKLRHCLIDSVPGVRVDFRRADAVGLDRGRMRQECADSGNKNGEMVRILIRPSR